MLQQSQPQQPQPQQQQQQQIAPQVAGRAAPIPRGQPEKITLQTADRCRHDISDEVTTCGTDGAVDGETVCGACGLVKDADDYEFQAAGEDSAAAVGGGRARITPLGVGISGSRPGADSPGRNRANLYLELSIGGRPDRTLRGAKYVRRPQGELETVSNLSQKLGVPNHVGMDVWAWYQRLRARLRLTKSKCLVLAFCKVCRLRGCPIDESRLRDCIRMDLGVRHAHTYLHVLMEASGHIGSDGEMTLRKIGYLDMNNDDNHAGGADRQRHAPRVQAPTASAAATGITPTPATPTTTTPTTDDNGLRYNMGCEIATMTRIYGPEIAGRIAQRARVLAGGLSARETNTRRAARIAVRMAERRVCGAAAVAAAAGSGGSSSARGAHRGGGGSR